MIKRITFKEKIERTKYAKKCEKLGELFIDMGIEYKQLSKSIQQHGIEENIKKMINARIEKYIKGENNGMANK